MHKNWCSVEDVPYFFFFLRSSIKFQDHMGQKIDDLNPTWVILLGQSQLSNPSDLSCFFAVTKQLYEWFCPFVHPSVSTSVRHNFFAVSVIVSSWNLQKSLSLTKEMSMQKVQVRGQKARSKSSKEILPKFGLFWTKTPVLNSQMARKLCTKLEVA